MHNQPVQPLSDLEALRKENERRHAANQQAKRDLETVLYNWWLSDQINTLDYNEAIAIVKRIHE